MNNKGQSITRAQFIEKLKKALRLNGDFPACAKTVNELKELASDPSTPANKISELILRDPSLSTKILNFVNSAFFQRGTQITTISQAVLHIGTRQLAELCSNFTLLQKLIPAAKKGSSFALTFERLIATSILTSLLNSLDSSNNKKTRDEESGYLIGTFSEIGLTLTAYYFPKLFENAYQKSLEKNIPLNESIRIVTGYDPLEISLEILVALKMPAVYTVSILTAIKYKAQNANVANLDATEQLTKNLLAAQEISNSMITNNYNEDLGHVLERVSLKYNINKQELEGLIVSFNKVFEEYCNSMQIELPTIDCLDEFIYERDNPEESYECPTSLLCVEDNSISENTKITVEKYLAQIKKGIEKEEPMASIITTIMEALVWGLNFERVLLLLTDIKRSKLQGRMFLGSSTDNLEPKNIIIPLEMTSTKVPAKCFFNGLITTTGDLVFPKDSSCLAIPIGIEEHCIGVIYASLTDPNNNVISTYTKEVAKIIFKELLTLTKGDE